jgi:hypothetical protein
MSGRGRDSGSFFSRPGCWCLVEIHTPVIYEMVDWANSRARVSWADRFWQRGGSSTERLPTVYFTAAVCCCSASSAPVSQLAGTSTTSAKPNTRLWDAQSRLTRPLTAWWRRFPRPLPCPSPSPPSTPTPPPLPLPTSAPWRLCRFPGRGPASPRHTKRPFCSLTHARPARHASAEARLLRTQGSSASERPAAKRPAAAAERGTKPM